MCRIAREVMTFLRTIVRYSKARDSIDNNPADLSMNSAGTRMPHLEVAYTFRVSAAHSTQACYKR